MSRSRIRALEVLEDILAAGLEVEADRPHLRIRPADRVTPALEERARAVKPELLDALGPPGPDGPCETCESVNYGRRAAGRWRCLECWHLTADEAAQYFFGPLNWEREVVPA